MDKLKKEHKQKVEELATAIHDRTRFKDLSEGYMKEVARLEAQLEEMDLKPKPRSTQRPKDTVKRGQSATTQNQAKMKRIEAKQLTDVVHVLKLKLQE